MIMTCHRCHKTLETVSGGICPECANGNSLKPEATLTCKVRVVSKEEGARKFADRIVADLEQWKEDTGIADLERELEQAKEINAILRAALWYACSAGGDPHRMEHYIKRAKADHVARMQACDSMNTAGDNINYTPPEHRVRGHTYREKDGSISGGFISPGEDTK